VFGDGGGGCFASTTDATGARMSSSDEGCGGPASPLATPWQAGSSGTGTGTGFAVMKASKMVGTRRFAREAGCVQWPWPWGSRPVP